MRIRALVVCTLAVVFCATFAAAQADTLKVDYFANVGGSIDQTLRITNPGTSGGGLCAAIYVFAPDQELSECCSCYVSPDGLRTLSVDTDLSSNPLTVGDAPVTGVIKIVSTPSSGKNCAKYPTSLDPTPAIRAWATHLQKNGTLTETASQDATLSGWEINSLEGDCSDIRLVGSGHGVCTCGTGD